MRLRTIFSSAAITAALVASPASAQSAQFGVGDGNRVLGPNAQAWDTARTMRAQWVRLIVRPGQEASYDATVAEASRHGLSVAVTVAPPARNAGSAGMLRTFVKRWPTVKAWSILNEPELSGVKPCAAAKTWRASGSMMRHEFPRKRYLVGELSPLAQASRFLAAIKGCGIKVRAGGLAMHPYQWNQDPLARGEHPLGIGNLRSVRKSIRAAGWLRTTKGSALPPYWLTEFGYFTNRVASPDRYISQAQAAAWWPRAFGQADRVGARVLIAWGFAQERSGPDWDTSLDAPAINAIAAR